MLEARPPSPALGHRRPHGDPRGKVHDSVAQSLRTPPSNSEYFSFSGRRIRGGSDSTEIELSSVLQIFGSFPSPLFSIADVEAPESAILSTSLTARGAETPGSLPGDADSSIVFSRYPTGTPSLDSWEAAILKLISTTSKLASDTYGITRTSSFTLSIYFASDVIVGLQSTSAY